MTLETDREGVSSVRIKLAKVISIAGAMASIVSVFMFIGGFIAGERYLSAELNSLRMTVSELKSGNAVTQEHLNNLDNKVTSISADIKYISQGVAELRLANVPKH
jgi:hypothetical protein